MTDRSVIHDTFSLERTYSAALSRTFAAFASAQAKDAWAATSTDETGLDEFDFRPGGRERFRVRRRNTTYSYDALYYDIVPNRRILYCYEMYANGTRISVSTATIEFEANPTGTTLTWTEQGVYLDGIDSSEAPKLRIGGTNKLLDSLAGYLEVR